MSVHALKQPKPVPHQGIIALLRERLAEAEAGLIQEMLLVWADAEAETIESDYYIANNAGMGASTYALAHALLTEEDE